MFMGFLRFKEGWTRSMIARYLPAVLLCFVLASSVSACSDSGTSPTQSNNPSPNGEVSFRNTVKPILLGHGCAGCHGGTSGLSVETVSQLLQGGNHGPAIIPGKAESSILVLKISPDPPFGARMPRGGPFLPASTIQIIKT